MSMEELRNQFNIPNEMLNSDGVLNERIACMRYGQDFAKCSESKTALLFEGKAYNGHEVYWLKGMHTPTVVVQGDNMYYHPEVLQMKEFRVINLPPELDMELQINHPISFNRYPSRR